MAEYKMILPSSFDDAAKAAKIAMERLKKSSCIALKENSFLQSVKNPASVVSPSKAFLSIGKSIGVHFRMGLIFAPLDELNASLGCLHYRFYSSQLKYTPLEEAVKNYNNTRNWYEYEWGDVLA